MDRLLGVWQLIYDVTQRYAEELKKLTGCDGMEEEEQKLSAITSQIQTALQATGENLEDGRLLLDYQGLTKEDLSSILIEFMTFALFKLIFLGYSQLTCL